MSKNPTAVEIWVGSQKLQEEFSNLMAGKCKENMVLVQKTTRITTRDNTSKTRNNTRQQHE